MMLKVALTERAADMLTVQVLAAPVHAPVHPEKLEPAPGVAVRVTEVFAAYCSMQSEPQLMPAGVDVTVPLPLPPRVTLSAKLGGTENNAVTVRLTLIDTTQVVALPVQAPVQPAKIEPAAGDAVNVTLLPSTYDSEQSAPQLMPTGDEVTVPEPAPERLTVSVRAGSLSNLAVTARASETTVVQVSSVLVHTPVQPANKESAAGVAVNVTNAFGVNDEVQVEPQLMPAGFDDTVPAPSPDFVTVMLYWGVVRKFALISCAWCISTTQTGLLPLQATALFQLSKVEPGSGVAVSVTDWPRS